MKICTVVFDTQAIVKSYKHIWNDRSIVTLDVASYFDKLSHQH